MGMYHIQVMYLGAQVIMSNIIFGIEDTGIDLLVCFIGNMACK